jgi:hypothetical protein
MNRRTTSPRQPAAPPATAAEGAAFVRDYAVKLYDRQDGQGVDWRQVAGSLLKAGLDALDNIPEDRQVAFLDRLQIQVYERMEAAKNIDAAPSNSSPSAADRMPSNTTGLKSPRPRPPRGAV